MKIIDHLRTHAELQGAKDALVSVAGALSYRDLLERVDVRAARLGADGIAAGSVVAITIGDEVSHFIVTLALLALGARQIVLATFDTDDVRGGLVRRAGVGWLVDRDGVRRIGAATGAPLDGADGSLLLRTSGTTGRPSLIEFASAQLAAQAANNPHYDLERLLFAASVEHNNGKRHRLYCLVAGGTNVFRPADDPDLVAFCARNAVSTIDVAPIHAAGFAATLRDRPLSKVTLRVSGAHMNPGLRHKVEANVTQRLSVRYGATECGTISIAGPGEHHDASVGVPAPGVAIEVVDADGVPCPVGVSGEIKIKTRGMASSYLGNPELSQRRFRDGWFWPGDAGRLRADGALIVEGRKDDMMILNGINIFPAEIEQVLENHPAVSAAAALPLDSPVHGQIPVAAVELVDGATASATELQAFAREHLALRAPRRILIMSALPRSELGKILRREIAVAFRPSRSTNDGS